MPIAASPRISASRSPIDVRRREAVCIAFAVVVAGCASTETVKEAQGQGVSRVYEQAYDVVYAAIKATAKAKELEIAEDDVAHGRLVLSHGVTLWSWGERIAIFVKRLPGNRTEVEIVSKPVLSPLNFPPDWPKILLDQIGAELLAGR